MNCFHCGDCCHGISPFSPPGTYCPYVVEKRGGFFFCSIYPRRPEECQKHEYPFRHCPIGIAKLDLETCTDIAKRIDEGWLRSGMKNFGK